MPSTSLDLGLQAVDDFGRGDLALVSGLRLIWMRPELSVVLVPSMPMNEETLSTAGSLRTTSTSCCWRSAMLVKLTVCGASLMPRMTPVSCTGKKPLGTTMKSRTVATKRGDGDQQSDEAVAQERPAGSARSRR